MSAVSNEQQKGDVDYLPLRINFEDGDLIIQTRPVNWETAVGHRQVIYKSTVHKAKLQTYCPALLGAYRKEEGASDVFDSTNIERPEEVTQPHIESQTGENLDESHSQRHGLPVVTVRESKDVLEVLLGFVYNDGRLLDLTMHNLPTLHLIWVAAVLYDCQALILYAEKSIV